MLSFEDASKKVNGIVDSFVELLYYRYSIDRYRIIQYAMAVLCKAKGECRVLNNVDSEFSVYGIDDQIIADTVRNIREVCGDKIADILPASADYLLSKFANASWGEFLQPRELTNLVLHLIKETGCKRIYNPFAGFASYALGDFIESYFGQELNFATCNMAKMRLELNNVNYAGIVNNNSITMWNVLDADCIVSTPPFGAIYNREDKALAGASSYEEFVLRKFLLNEVNYGFFVVSRGLCNSYSKYYEIRKELVDENVLDMIIDLPAKMFANTSIATTIIVLNKMRGNSDRIKFVDCSNCFSVIENHKNSLDVKAVLDIIYSNKNSNKAEVSREEIVNADYNCTPQRYTLKLEVPEGYVKVSMKDIATLTSTGNQIQDNGERGEYVYEPTILISQIAPKADYIEASQEKPVFIKASRYIKCQLDESKIDKDYFLYKYEHLDTKMFWAYMVGATIKRFTIRSLSELQFCIPEGLQNQRNALVEAKQAELEANLRASGLETLLEKKKREYIDVVRTRKHDMMPYVRELGAFERMVRHYISKENGMSDISEKMNSLLDKHHEALSKLSELIDVFSDEQQFGKTEQFNINEYFVDLEENHSDTSIYSIKYERDDEALSELIPLPMGGYYDENYNPVDPDSEEGRMLMQDDERFPVIVDINHLDFERLVRNIIENAVSHGFTDPNRDDYSLFIRLSIDFDKYMFQIDFLNNGTPLPAGMNKMRYGLLGEKAGLTGKTGRGGYIVKSIVEHYHGDYDVFIDGPNTVVRILLPIAKYDYEEGYEDF